MASFVRRGVGIVAVAACLAASASFADHQPSIVADNRRGAPPLLGGYDATGAIIEGDWGLYRPGAGILTVYPAESLFIAAPPPGAYYPHTGRPPRYGRYEIDPAPGRRLPRPAPSYHRYWSTDSLGHEPHAFPLAAPPPVIEAMPLERFERRQRRHHSHKPHINK